MTLQRFWVDASIAHGDQGTLTADQARQVSRVLRLATGDEIVLLNGTGIEARAALTAVDRDRVAWQVVACSRPDREPPLRLTVALALLRGERFDLAIQKLTELGVARIVPLAAERCVVSFDVAREWPKRRERWARIAREAAEQSERVTLPELEPPLSPAAFFQREPVIAFVERADATPLAAVPPAEALALAIGPEGGWSPAELATIARHAAGAASLGRLILRAETAAIVAAGSLIQRAWAERPHRSTTS